MRGFLREISITDRGSKKQELHPITAWTYQFEGLNPGSSLERGSQLILDLSQHRRDRQALISPGIRIPRALPNESSYPGLNLSTEMQNPHSIVDFKRRFEGFNRSFSLERGSQMIFDLGQSPLGRRALTSPGARIPLSLPKEVYRSSLDLCTKKVESHSSITELKRPATSPDEAKLRLFPVPGSPYYVWVERAELVKHIVVLRPHVPMNPAEALPYGAVGFVVGGRAVPSSRQTPLRDAVLEIPAIYTEAAAPIITWGLERLGVPPFGALVGGKLGAFLLVRFTVKPLVVHLQIGAELLNCVSILLPHGDPRVLASVESARGWTEMMISRRLSHYLTDETDWLGGNSPRK